LAAAEAGIRSGVDGVADVEAGTSRYVPDMAHHERYRAGRERQARLEQTLLLTGEFI
jgi:hypothetical protein